MGFRVGSLQCQAFAVQPSAVGVAVSVAEPWPFTQAGDCGVRFRILGSRCGSREFLKQSKCDSGDPVGEARLFCRRSSDRLLPEHLGAQRRDPLSGDVIPAPSRRYHRRRARRDMGFTSTKAPEHGRSWEELGSK